MASTEGSQQENEVHATAVVVRSGQRILQPQIEVIDAFVLRVADLP